MKLREERQLLAEYCHRFEADGLVVGTAGNMAIRNGDFVAITPTGLPYQSITPEDLAVVSADTGEQVEGAYRPTSELHLHLQALRVTGLDAVVHTHSTYATAVACLHGVTELPDVHYVTGTFGPGSIPITEYAQYGSQLLADRVEHALSSHTGCLLGNHGSVTAGKDLQQAYTKAQTLEWLAKVWLIARGAGEPRILSPEEMEQCLASLATYGQPHSV